MAARKQIDWESVEIAYRAGVQTLREIAADNDISHGAINKRAKRDGWVRDLSAKIKAKADELVSKQAVSKKVSKTKREAESKVIEANAKIQSDIILAHRTGIPNKRELVEKLCAEIEGLTDNTNLVEQMTLALQQGDMDALAKVARKVSTLPSRIKGVSDLVNAYRVLVDMERKAFGIDKSFPGDDDPVTAIVRKIVTGNG